MVSLASWAAIWILIHRLISGGPLRGWFAKSIGERPYRLVFALLSVACLAALSHAYANVKPVGSSVTSAWVAIVAVVDLLASLLIVAGLSTRNPTTGSLGKTVEEPDIVRGMIRVTRHPFLWGIILWSASHLLVRHDPAAMLFFGSIGAVAAMGMWSIDRKRRLVLGAAWTEFSRETSMVPFAAILAGRQPFVIGEIGGWRIIAALSLWVAMLWLHPFFGANLRLFPILA